MITLNNVSKWYGTTQVLKSCSASVARGEVVVVCGRSFHELPVAVGIEQRDSD